MTIYEFARREFEKRYNCMMQVKKWGTIKIGNITDGGWVPIGPLVPCRLSQKKAIQPTSDGSFSTASKTTELYCNPDVTIEEGSLIDVTDVHGRVTTYKRTSAPSNHHNTHQAITIDLNEVV